jgi:hypothetical protein
MLATHNDIQMLSVVNDGQGTRDEDEKWKGIRISGIRKNPGIRASGVLLAGILMH